MATITQRIEGVTENVTDGKLEIATAINSKNAKDVNVSNTATFITMANAINKINVEQVTPPTVSFNNSTLTMTLTNSIDGVENYYRKKGSVWVQYTSPEVISDFGTYQFYASKSGSKDSEIIEQYVGKEFYVYNTFKINSPWTFETNSISNEEFMPPINVGTLDMHGSTSNGGPFQIGFYEGWADEDGNEYECPKIIKYEMLSSDPGWEEWENYQQVVSFSRNRITINNNSVGVDIKLASNNLFRFDYNTGKSIFLSIKF